MEFSVAKETALQWTQNSCIPFQLVGAIEDERRLIFSAEISKQDQAKESQSKNADLHAPVSKAPGDGAVSTSLQDTTVVVRPCSFYVVCPECAEENAEGDVAEGWQSPSWHVWSDDADVLPRLSAVQDFLHTCREKKLIEILDKILICLKKFLSTNPEDDVVADDEDAGYQDDDDELALSDALDEGNDDDDAGEGMQILPGASGADEAPGSFFVGHASQIAVHRILKDLKQLKEDACRDYGIEGSPRGDNLFIWDVRLKDFPTDTRLGKDLDRYAQKYKREAAIHLEMRFPDDYPMAPPFVRVIRPKFRSQTGHITIGGSVCMEMLTRSGWRPTNDIEGILVQIRAEIMSDPNSSLDPQAPDREYNETEAKVAFNRMVQRYGWK